MSRTKSGYYFAYKIRGSECNQSVGSPLVAAWCANAEIYYEKVTDTYRCLVHFPRLTTIDVARRQLMRYFDESFCICDTPDLWRRTSRELGEHVEL